MKKAIALLYVIAAVQAVGTLTGFAVAYKVFNLSMYEAGKSFGAEMIKICDQRYQLK